MLRIQALNTLRTVTTRRSLHTTLRAISSYTTVTDAIKHDHRELEAYYKNFCDAKTEARREEWRNLFVWELARHSISEELIVYPAFESHLGTQGISMAEQDRAEHQTVKNRLYELQNTSVGDDNVADVRGMFDRLMESLREHIKHEEEGDLPSLEAVLSSDDTKKMADSFERTKKFVPTRSHPNAPDKPPFETVVGLMAAPIDKLRDAFTRFPPESEKPGIPT